MDNSFFLDAMDWSYTRVSSFDQCPRMFDLTYLQCRDRVENAFAQWGSLGHSILERYFKNQIELWDMSRIYEHEYSTAVSERFPFRQLEENYYKRGLAYFNDFSGRIGDEIEVLGVEERYSSTLGGRPVVGVIDLIQRNESGLVICDHKSRGKWKSREERRKYLRQLNLYAFRLKEQYGEWPAELWFNKFREGRLDREPFSKTVAQDDMDWFLRSIDNIYQADRFPANPDRFFCDHLCSVRGHCEHSPSFEGDFYE